MTSPLAGVAPYASTSPNQTNQAGQSNSTGQTGSSTSTDSKSLIDPQAFLQLLVAQLQYQDPTNPADTSSFLSQTATLTQVQSMDSMTSTLASLLSAQQAQSATAMIGKQITYTDSAGTAQQGIVSAVSLSGGVASLQVGGTGGSSVPLSSVSEVTEAPAPA